MYESLTVSPAYERDYKSKEQVLKAWEEMKDFQIETPGVRGKYINKHDAVRYGIAEINIRYDKKRKKLIVKVKEGEDAN